jgi:1-deoxy-D-xylulose-5-phosphate reductoisomerase
VPQKIAILGSTGSIGVSTLKVVDKLSPAFEVVALTANTRIGPLARQVRRYRPRIAAIHDESLYPEFKRLAGGTRTKLLAGREGLEAAAAASGARIVVSAIVGAAGLHPTLAAIRKGLTIGLANKETLVMAGEVMSREAARSGSRILPIDSEHCAVFQCLAGNPDPALVHRIILTASGGPFRDLPRSRFSRISVKQALNHPTWSMGAKITIDSATMMNKGLEVIEAHFLFKEPYSRIDVLVHPESIIHSMVEYVDGSVLAQLGTTDMQIPIQYALTYPSRAMTPVPRLDLAGLGRLHFHAPDRAKFPCIGLAYEAGRRGGTAPAVLNAANEVAVRRFLEGGLRFDRIPRIIEKVLSRHRPLTSGGLDGILSADRWARLEAESTR